MCTWDSYASIYASYEFNAITNVIRNTGIYTFHIISICTQTYMFHTSDICATTLLLWSTCKAHITEHKRKETTNCSSSYHSITIYVYTTCPSNATYENTSCTHETTMSIFMHLIWTYCNEFNITGITPEQICLPHHTFMSHCTSTVVCIQTQNQIKNQ